MSEENNNFRNGFAPGSVTVFILAGGLGTRLRPVLSDRPKCLAPVHGRPFLSYQLDMLEKCGFKQVILCTGYLADLIRWEIGNQHGLLKIDYSEESAPLGTGGALRLALEKSGADLFLVLNGDSYCEVNLVTFLASFGRLDRAALVLAKVEDSGRYGGVQTESDGRITRFLEKGESRPGWINAGIYLIPRIFLEGINPQEKISMENEVFPEWVRKSLIFGFKGSGKFIDIGTPESLNEAGAFFQKI